MNQAKNLIDNGIQNKDYKDLLKEVDEESVDLLLTDIPYNINYLDKEWDNGQFSVEDFIELVTPKISPKGTAVVFFDQHQVGPLMAEFARNSWGVVDKRAAELNIWFKPNFKDRKPKDRPSHTFETYIVATKTSECTFNLSIDAQLAGKEYETNILKFASNENTAERIHVTQKPFSLWKHLMEVYSNPGDLVLDPVGGSGVTAAVACRMGRRFIVGERERNMAYFANQQLLAAKRDAMWPEYFTGYQPNKPVPKDTLASAIDQRILKDLVRLQHQYELVAMVSYVLENGKIIKFKDLEGVNFEVTGDDRSSEGQYLVVYENTKGKLVYTGDDEKPGMLPVNKGRYKLKSIKQQTGLRRHDNMKREGYYYYLWYFSLLYFNPRDSADLFESFYDEDTFGENPVLNALRGARSKFESPNGDVPPTAEEIEDQLALTPDMVRDSNLKYLTAKNVKNKSTSTRNRREQGGRSVKDTKKENAQNLKARLRHYKRLYIEFDGNNQEFYTSKGLSRATFYNYKKQWGKITIATEEYALDLKSQLDKAQKENAKLLEKIKELRQSAKNKKV